MAITREKLADRLVKLKEVQEQLKQQFISIAGQIAELEFQLAEDAKELEPKSNG